MEQEPQPTAEGMALHSCGCHGSSSSSAAGHYQHCSSAGIFFGLRLL